MPCIGVAIIFYSLGLISFVILWAWLDEREDGYCNVVIPQETLTSIEWSLRKHSIPDQYPVQPNKKITRGHLGRMDHRAMARYTMWIQQCHGPTSP